jgi:antitoxin component YwqK of YwqJK toxin-antitoxin module
MKGFSSLTFSSMKTKFNFGTLWFPNLNFLQKLYTPKNKDAYLHGQLKELTQFKDGGEDGKSVTYYENGQLEKEYRYQKSEKHGICKKFYKSGYIAEEIEYENGTKNGKYSEWYDKQFFANTYKCIVLAMCVLIISIILFSAAGIISLSYEIDKRKIDLSIKFI